MEEEKALLEAYQASLNELDSNCKIKINGLTMVADENKDHAIAIAACIENQLKTVPKQWKLPVLYLIDSICKNFPKSLYVTLFTQNIVSNFCNVFEVSDEKVRKSLHKLRMTWSKTKIFPQKKLNAIDKRVHEMDPNWPILNKLAVGPGTNPNSMSHSNSIQRQQQIQQQQLLKQGQQQQHLQHQHQHHHQQQQQLLIQNHEQQLPPIFELVPTQQYISNPAQQTNSQPTMLVSTAPPQPPQMMYTPYNQIQSQPQAPATQILCTPFDQIQNQPPQPPPPLGPQLICTPFDTIQSQPLPPPQPLQPQQQQLPNLPTSPSSQPTVVQTTTTIIQQPIETNLPTHLTVLESLYGGKQCSNCSLRFDDNNKYAIHLDWHFRQNLKNDNMFARRKWYYPLNLWVQFREINDDDLQDTNNFDNNDTNDLLLSANENEVPTAPASKDDEMNICSVCHETFEKFWAEEEEEWQLKNAKLYDDERVYHPSCLIDMLQANANANEANTSG